jgi:mannose-6-phosphate isomerase-like protein (cupin superfamily)
MLEPVVHHFDLPLAPGQRFQSFPAFHGRTRNVEAMACHASVLPPGGVPHPPHAHAEEEILIPLNGEVELRIANSPDDPAPRIVRAAPGSFVYYPAFQHHTICNPGDATVAYLMLKWTAPAAGRTSPAGTTFVHSIDTLPVEGAGGFRTRLLLQAPTSWLARLQAHVTELEPGAGYEPHADGHDVAIIPIAGTIGTLGTRATRGGVVYIPAGSLHGMRNPGSERARYLVFEFHAPPGRMRRAGAAMRRTARRVLDGSLRLARRVARAAGVRRHRAGAIDPTADRPRVRH